MQYKNAVRVVYTQGNVTNVQGLMQKKPLQIGLAEKDLCIFKGKASVILDFGKELSGGARILVHGTQGNKMVRLRFGESVSETCAQLGEKGACNDHSNRDFCIPLQSYSDMTFGQTGYRFLRIDTLSEDTCITFKTVVAAVDTDTREEVGSFTCDDDLVNTIWDTAAYTLRLCLQNGYIWDGIKRDRLVWIGDLYPEVRAAHCLFGEVPETLNCLDFSMDQAPLPSYVNGMPAYSLWWILCLCQAYEISGKKEKFTQYIPYTKGIIEQIIKPAVSADGGVSYGDNFIDWPSCPMEGELDAERKHQERLAGIAYLTKIALRDAKVFLAEFDEDLSLCDELLTKIDQKSYDIQIFKQIAALGVWADMSNESIKNLLLSGGGKGLSTFQSYPILTGVAKFGAYKDALSMMKEYYGGMLSVGATTFWEDFDLEWLKGCGRIDEMPQEGLIDIHGDYGNFCYIGFRHSFCHAWSAGVIPYLMETVAGIKTEGAGMRRIKIQPQLSGLKHVKVNFPTPYGILSVEHTLLDDGSIKTEYDAPEQIEIILG